ncbi:hypothetical protein TWF718_007563 [Orbilia javanica]|uniref:Uncharacterized protein n=1 Tax=Orbilia javanica TaxID=47235 RepID=A0AAN8MYE1_9PEZI
MEYVAFPYTEPEEDRETYGSMGGIPFHKEMLKTNKKIGHAVLFSQQREGHKKIVRNHRTILEISRRLIKFRLSRKVKRDLLLKKSEQAQTYGMDNLICLEITDGDERRLIAAIYRFFVGINFTFRKKIINGRRYDYRSYDICFLSAMETWGSQGMAAVKLIRNFFVDKLIPIQYSKSYYQIWKLKMSSDGETDDEVTFPIRRLLFHEFPENILPWIDGGYFKDPDRFHKRLQTIEASTIEPTVYFWQTRSRNPSDIVFTWEQGERMNDTAGFCSWSPQEWYQDKRGPHTGPPHHRSFRRSDVRKITEYKYYSVYDRLEECLEYDPKYSQRLDPEAAILDVDTLQDRGFCFCCWRPSRSERYESLYDEEPENLWRTLGSGCLIVYEARESDIHTDEFSLRSKSDNWEAFGRIVRYNARKGKWRKREMRRDSGLTTFIDRGFKSRGKPKGKQRAMLHAGFD